MYFLTLVENKGNGQQEKLKSRQGSAVKTRKRFYSAIMQ